MNQPSAAQSIAFLSAGIATDELARWAKRVLSGWPVRPLPVVAFNLDGKPDAIAILLGPLTVNALAPAALTDLLDDPPAPIVLIGAGTASLSIDPASPIIRLPAECDERSIAAALHSAASMSRHAASLRQRCKRLERAADTAAAQIEKLDEDLQAGAMLQRQLLPSTLPNTLAYQSAAICRPGSSLNGDMYDAVMLDEHHLGLFVADACGHGVPAALTLMLTSRLLPMLEPHASGARILPPEEALARLNNRFINRRGDSHLLVTAAYAVLDLQSWELTTSVAGHPPPMIFSRDGSISLSAGGPPLGAMSDINYASQTARLHPGDTLAMFTDGLELAFDDRDQSALGHERYIRRIAHLAELCASKGLALAMQEFEHTLSNQHGSLHQRDDITLFALHRTNEAQSVRRAA